MGLPTLPERVGAQDVVLLYDGLCGFCDGMVRWLMRRNDPEDRTGSIYFAAQQTELAQAILARNGMADADRHSVYLVVYPGTNRERVLARSSAVIRAATMLGGVWTPLASLVSVVPRGLRDAVYGIVSRNRYRIAGRRAECRLPTAAEKARFLGL
jgi:predicted DCC family thiol-disulfide oxidoreductase YuxK